MLDLFRETSMIFDLPVCGHWRAALVFVGARLDCVLLGASAVTAQSAP